MFRPICFLGQYSECFQGLKYQINRSLIVSKSVYQVYRIDIIGNMVNILIYSYCVSGISNSDIT